MAKRILISSAFLSFFLGLAIPRTKYYQNYRIKKLIRLEIETYCADKVCPEDHKEKLQAELEKQYLK